ncbi:MAG: hypothetical protein RIQ81_2386 [Pseudomonadota bacterium]|jgi:hypothetical protein
MSINFPRAIVRPALGALAALCLAASPALANPAWRNCTESMYDEAQEVFAHVQKAMADGIFSGFEVAGYQITMLDIGLCAGKLERSEFCSQKSAVIDEQAENIRRLVALGTPVTVARKELLGWQADLATVCGSKKSN